MWHSYKVREKIHITEMYSLFEAEYESTVQAEKQSAQFWKPEYTA